MIYYNKDTTYAKMCGNGINSLIHYLYHKNLIKDKGIIYSDIYEIEYEINEVIKTTHNKATFLKKIYHHNQNIFLFNAYVNHAIIFVKNLNNKKLEKTYKYLKKQYNTTFIKKYKDGFYLDTYEIGANKTTSCLTSSLALATILSLDKINVYFKLGKIKINTSNNITIYSTTKKVFEGIYYET